MTSKWQLIDCPKFSDPRGNLTFIEGDRHIPFDIKRIYYLYDVPPDAERGAHGHKRLKQLIVPLAGQFKITLDDGKKREIFKLQESSQGLYVPPMVWRELNEFSSNAVCLVLASEYYDENDYYRDYSEFLRDIRGEE